MVSSGCRLEGDGAWLGLAVRQGDVRCAGFVRITEVVHHAHQGWNVHFHAPLLLEHPIDEAGLAELKDRLTTRFTRCVENAGGAATGPGQDLQLIRPGTESRIAGYLAKGTTASWSDESRTPRLFWLT